ncbi:phage tail protein [Rhizobium leguminosarum]|uniref:phage tail protein n=1 Tax=Rhizobium leguminosarum TaxID=384 RepID=UPI000484E97C|nr:phage tail protein [Rhizobium leguminosarum]
MAETGRRHDPFPGFRFLLELNSIPVGGFSECSGLDLELEVEEYAEGGENRFVHKLPGRRKQSDLVLKRGLSGIELWKWFNDQKAGAVRTTSIGLSVQAYDPAQRPMTFEIHDAFPIRWQGPQLDAAQSIIATETLTLAHHGLKLI